MKAWLPDRTLDARLSVAGMFQLFGREPQDLIDDDHDHSNDGDDHNDFDENQITALTMAWFLKCLQWWCCGDDDIDNDGDDINNDDGNYNNDDDDDDDGDNDLPALTMAWFRKNDAAAPAAASSAWHLYNWSWTSKAGGELINIAKNW